MHWIVEALEKARVDGSAFLTPLVDEARKQKEAARKSLNKNKKKLNKSENAMCDDPSAKDSEQAIKSSAPSKRERDVNSDPDGDVAMTSDGASSEVSSNVDAVGSTLSEQGSNHKKAKISS